MYYMSMFPLYMNIIPYVTHMVYLGLMTYLAFVFLFPHYMQEGIDRKMQGYVPHLHLLLPKMSQHMVSSKRYGLTPYKIPRYRRSHVAHGTKGKI